MWKFKNVWINIILKRQLIFDCCKLKRLLLIYVQENKITRHLNIKIQLYYYSIKSHIALEISILCYCIYVYSKLTISFVCSIEDPHKGNNMCSMCHCFLSVHIIYILSVISKYFIFICYHSLCVVLCENHIFNEFSVNKVLISYIIYNNNSRDPNVVDLGPYSDVIPPWTPRAREGASLEDSTRFRSPVAHESWTETSAGTYKEKKYVTVN